MLDGFQIDWKKTNKSGHHRQLKRYPMLEHFQLTPLKEFIIDELFKRRFNKIVSS